MAGAAGLLGALSVMAFAAAWARRVDPNILALIRSSRHAGARPLLAQTVDRIVLSKTLRRLARERSFLETLFNTIEDGILVVDENARILYLNSAVSALLGLQQNIEAQPASRYLPEIDWQRLISIDVEGGTKVVRQEFQVHFPKPRYLHMYAAPLDGVKTGSAGVALVLHDATEARQKAFEAIESERLQALTLLGG